MAKPKLFLCSLDWVDHEGLEKLKEHCDVTCNELGRQPTKQELTQIVSSYDGIVLGVTNTVDKEILANSNLQFAGILAKGLDSIDVGAFKEKGIAFFYTPDANIQATAEHALALLLALTKKTVPFDAMVRDKAWESPPQAQTEELSNKTLGLIGAGATGKALAKMAKGLGMDVLCHTKTPSKHEAFAAFVSLKELLARSDVVSIHTPHTKDTEHLINEEAFTMMKPSSYLINIARGKVVDEQALITALKKHHIAGAGLDVYEEEPPTNELLTLKNVVLSPHCAGVAKESLARMQRHITNDIIAYLEERTPKYRVV